jgi:hypothetical protein
MSGLKKLIEYLKNISFIFLKKKDVFGRGFEMKVPNTFFLSISLR